VQQTASGAAASAVSAPAGSPEAVIRNKLIQTYGDQDLEVLSVTPAPVSGLYEVFLSGNQLVYMTADGNYMFTGDLIDVTKRSNLSETRREELNRIDFSTLPPDSARWEWLEEVVRRTMRRFAFANIRTPIVEHTALFARGLGVFFKVAGGRAEAPADERFLLEAVSDELIAALRPDAEERLVVAGTANLARATPDFSSLGPLLDAVEEQVVLLRLFTAADGAPTGENRMRVSIGSENKDDALAEASVVTTTYGPGTGEAVAHLGVIGPTRMDYPATMAAVRAVARYLSRFLAETDDAIP